MMVARTVRENMWKQCIGVLLLCVSCAHGQIRLAGEVARGSEFRKELGAGLVFILTPTESGWTIGIVPKTKCSEEGDWAAVANAPYRGYNALNLDSSYGITAQEAVKINPREFSFAADCEGYKNEARRLETVLWSYTHPQAEVDDAMAKLGTSRLGKGKLTILDAKVSHAEQDIDGKNYGRIDRLKFRLEVELPGPPKR